MAKGDLPINWGFGEMIAYASLLEENFPIEIYRSRYKKEELLITSP